MSAESFKHTKVKGAKYDYDGFLDKSKNAYWLENGKVKYTFGTPFIQVNNHDKHNDDDGWKLTWTSNEICDASTKKKFDFTIEADCDKTVSKGSAPFKWLV